MHSFARWGPYVEKIIVPDFLEEYRFDSKCLLAGEVGEGRKRVSAKELRRRRRGAATERKLPPFGAGR